MFLSATALGIAVALRGNFLPFLAMAVCWVIYVARLHRQSARWSVVMFTVLAMLPLLLIGLRNFIVADQFVMIPTSGKFNLWLAHRFTEFSEFAWGPPGIPAADVIFAETLRLMTEDPVGLLRRSYLKLLHILGFNAFDGFELEKRVFIPNVLCLLSLAYLWLSHVRRDELLLYMAWIFGNACILILIFPWGYGWRLSASMFPFVYLVNALAIVHLYRRSRNRGLAPEPGKERRNIEVAGPNVISGELGE